MGFGWHILGGGPGYEISKALYIKLPESYECLLLAAPHNKPAEENSLQQRANLLQGLQGELADTALNSAFIADDFCICSCCNFFSEEVILPLKVLIFLAMLVKDCTDFNDDSNYRIFGA